ncbi:peptidase [Dictyobacter alpinus]|uniref:Peptidase n=1 Tax=Dictyobacter alpinus TaxID=2014873 RepID=A0A402B3R0_9CHLR|nr:M48 family metallopeptidase [Dictyobacter alpinus]GCE25981.1 peptidase [Dictyobacter alpinus]
MEIDVDRQQKARAYARTRRRLSYVSMSIGVLSILIVLGAGLDKWFRDVVESAGSWFPLLTWQPHPAWFPWQIAVYCLLITLLYEVLTFPLSYYSGFVLPRRYGISVMSIGAWFRELLVGLSLSLVLEVVFVSLIYALLAFQPQLWWLWTALIILFFSVVMANLAPVLIYPLFYKFTPLPEGELTQRLLKLAEQANTRVRGVFSMKMSNKTTGTNAALMGLGNTRRIVLGDTMIDRYAIDEIEVVLAHELGHHVHRDIWKLIASQALLMLVGLFVSNLLLHWVIDQQHYYRSLTDPATLPFFFTLLAIFSFIIMPLSNGYSRLIEYQADEYALQSTHKIEAFKSAMRRLADQNLSEIEPAPIVEFIFHSHPSIKKRLEHADEFAARSGYAGSAALSAES